MLGLSSEAPGALAEERCTGDGRFPELHLWGKARVWPATSLLPLGHCQAWGCEQSGWAKNSGLLAALGQGWGKTQ